MLNKAKVFTISTVKGGVGKTTFTLNLAAIFKRLNKKVLVVDLDLYCGDVASTLNIPNARDIYNLFEDINNNKLNDFDDYITTYTENIDVLPSPKDPRFARKINSKVLDIILYKASLKYDIILIDTNHILTDINLFAFDYSDQILYLINNDSMNLKNMKSFISILNDMEKTNYKVILYDAREKGRNFYNKYDIKNIINKGVDYIIPDTFYFKNMDKYVIKGDILMLDNSIYRKYKNTSRILNMIAKDLLTEGSVNNE